MFRLSLVSAAAQSELWSEPKGSDQSSDWAATETKRKNRLYFLAHLRLNVVLGSAKRLSHGLSQKVKWPILSLRVLVHTAHWGLWWLCAVQIYILLTLFLTYLLLFSGFVWQPHIHLKNDTYRVGQIKWHHFIFLLVTHECIHKILWFLAHLNYIMQKIRWC